LNTYFKDNNYNTTMNQYVTYNADYQVLICRQHGYAIPRDYIVRHFRTFHKTIPLETRQKIAEYGKSLILLSPDNVDIPRDVPHPIDDLTIMNGFECNYEQCGELLGTMFSIRKHCNAVHGWDVSQGVMWRKKIVQTFFQGSNRKCASTKGLF